MVFKTKSNINEAKLADAIKRILVRMAGVEPGSDEYQSLLTNLKRLTDLKAKDGPKRISPDALVAVAGNLIGILIIVAYEREHVLTSKAMSFLKNIKS